MGRFVPIPDSCIAANYSSTPIGTGEHATRGLRPCHSRLEVFIEPLQRELLRLKPRRAVDAVMGNVGNDDQIFLHSLEAVISTDSGAVVEQFLIAGKHDLYGAIWREAHRLGWRVGEKVLANWSAVEVANHYRARFRIAQFSARPPCSLVICDPLETVEVGRADLAVHSLDAMIVPGDVDDQSAREAGAPDAEAADVALGFSLDPVKCVEPIR